LLYSFIFKDEFEFEIELKSGTAEETVCEILEAALVKVSAGSLNNLVDEDFLGENSDDALFFIVDADLYIPSEERGEEPLTFSNLFEILFIDLFNDI
jgi:hypothetical protein